MYAITSGGLAERGGRLPLFGLNIQKRGKNKLIVYKKRGKMSKIRLKNGAKQDDDA